MLFDQPINYLQEGFSGLNWINYTGMTAGITFFETSAGKLRISAPGEDILRLQIRRSPEQDYGILVDPEELERQAAGAGLKIQDDVFRVNFL